MMTVKPENTNTSYAQRALWVCNTLFHNTVAIITFFILYILFNYNKIESKGLWHAFWCTIAFCPTVKSFCAVSSSDPIGRPTCSPLNVPDCNKPSTIYRVVMNSAVDRCLLKFTQDITIRKEFIVYVPLMAEGFVLFSESNSWTLKVRRNTKYYLHGIVLLVSVITVTIGIVLDYQQKEKFNGKHFTSKHGKTGLASWILCFISILFGLFAFYSQWLKKIIPPVYLKFIHNLCGLAAYIVGIASLCLALDYRTFSGFVTHDGKNYTLYTIIAITIWSSLEALKSLYTQVRAMF